MTDIRIDSSQKLLPAVVEIEVSELHRLKDLERRIRAVVGYYSNTDLAAHLAASQDGGEVYSPDGVVRKVWINHKLCAAFDQLREDLGLK